MNKAASYSERSPTDQGGGEGGKESMGGGLWWESRMARWGKARGLKVRNNGLSPLDCRS